MKVSPVPMLPDEITNIDRAAHRAKVCTKTIRRWVHENGIGRQSGRNAPLQISLVALEMRMEGDFEALELLRSNRREDPIVSRFLDRVGVMR